MLSVSGSSSNGNYPHGAWMCVDRHLKISPYWLLPCACWTLQPRVLPWFWCRTGAGTDIAVETSVLHRFPFHDVLKAILARPNNLSRYRLLPLSFNRWAVSITYPRRLPACFFRGRLTQQA